MIQTCEGSGGRSGAVRQGLAEVEYGHGGSPAGFDAHGEAGVKLNATCL